MDIPSMEKDIGTDIDDLTRTLREKLQEYLMQFIATNGKTEDDRKLILAKIELPFTAIPPPLSKANIIARFALYSFTFGLLYGPLFAITRHENVHAYAWIGGLSLLVFGFTLAYFITKGEEIYRYVLGGALGGLLGHVVWSVLGGNVLIDDLASLRIDKMEHLILGLSYGLGIGVGFWFCRYRVSRLKTQSVYVKYLLSMGVGSLIFLLLSAAFLTQYMMVYVRSAIIGMLVMAALIISTDAFRMHGQRRRQGGNCHTLRLWGTIRPPTVASRRKTTIALS